MRLHILPEELVYISFEDRVRFTYLTGENEKAMF